MTEVESILSIEVIQIGLGLLALGLLSGAWLARRAEVDPLGYWPMAWAVLIGIGALRIAGIPHPFELFGTAIFCALMLAGAYRYADRPIPKGLFPIGSGIGLGLLLIGFSPASHLTGYLSFVLWPIAILSAAAVVHLAARQRHASLLHRVLPLGFVVLAALGTADHLVMDRSVEGFGMWLLGAVPIATNQAVAMFDRIRSRADGIARELEESVSLLRATLDSTADGLLVVDLEGRYTHHNRSFRSIWGIPDDATDEDIRDVVVRNGVGQLTDPASAYAHVDSVFADPDAETFDTLEFKDGRVFERHSTPQRVGDQIVGRVWSFRDITPHRRAEEVAARYQDHLEEVVQERTRQLIESRDRLRQADRLAAIGTLAAGVAHQINNPIGAILNSAQYALLCQDEDNALEEFREALLVNAEEARRCGEIVHGMLQFARQEPVDKLVADLNYVVRLSLKAVDRYAEERKVKIETEFTVEPLPVLMSVIEMEQVIVNLLHNAIESRPLGAAVRVRTFLERDLAYVEVTDDGVGIEANDQDRIFDPFFSTRIRDGGTGLGLSVAHGILTDHGGKFRVDSARDSGTTITLELPLAPDSDVNPEPP